MSQHFLLSAQARTLSAYKVMQMSEADAFSVFRELRWGAGETVACPCCGVVGKHAFRKDRLQWKCQDCAHTFSVTSGTIFSNHKLPLKKYLAAIAIFSNAAKGVSALQLSRDLGTQYKTAFVLAHKIRESLMEHRDESALAGEIRYYVAVAITFNKQCVTQYRDRLSNPLSKGNYIVDLLKI